MSILSMSNNTTAGLVVFSFSVFLILTGRVLRSWGKRCSVPDRETDEEWRERVGRQESMIDRMEELRSQLEGYNGELRKYKRLIEEKEGDEAYCYWLKGQTRAEQAEAVVAELEELISRYESEYGMDDAEV